MSEGRFSAPKLIALMKERGLNDYKVAELTGISRTMIFYLRKGQRPNVSTAIIAKLAAGLKVPVAELTTNSNSASSAKTEIPEPIRRLSRIAGELSEVRQEELVQIAAALAKLEREQVTDPLPAGTMTQLLWIVEKLRQSGANEDVLADLEDLLHNLPPPPV